MPRPLRIQYENAWYHVMNRGSNHQKIFLSTTLRQYFLFLLEEISKKFFIEIHSYCLMDNHYHLLIRTPYANLSKAIRYLDGVYTQKFNKLLGRDGSLFRGRYKAILVEEERYLLYVSRYIHLNPVSAKICKDPLEFMWSSIHNYINYNTISWVKTFFILSLTGNSIQNYIKYLEQGIDEETSDFFSKKNMPSIFGSKTFIHEKLESLNTPYQKSVLTDVNRTKRLFELEYIEKIVANYFQISIEDIKKSKRGTINTPRIIAIYLSRRFSLYSHKTIAAFFTGLNTRSISGILKRCEHLINNNEQFCKLVNAISANIVSDGT